MKLMSVLSGKGFVMYNKDLARTVSVNASIIFGQLCSSYESFGSKGMLTVRGEKEYFFLTSETLLEETSLTYKQQLKATKELEQTGYIETRMMGVPSKKYFHITEKVVEQYLKGNPSSAKREDLIVSTVEEQHLHNVTPSYDKRSTLGMTKGHSKPLQKGSAIKKKNKKEQDKDNNEKLLINKDINNFKSLMMNSFENHYNEFAVGRWSKKDYFTIADQFINEVINDNRYLEIPEEKIEGYVYQSLKNIAYKSDFKHGKIDLKNRLSKNVPVYDWLNYDNEGIPY
ncbi:hypothetical protein ACQCVB_11080 [Fictibacillus phosphorivorans]|uniref:hypothetical protein n=1 Tax=Fictibacillus phosphorivorans TaxID=1221500 RepID=UPI003CFB86B9